jgi:hypothetical protein
MDMTRTKKITSRGTTTIHGHELESAHEKTELKCNFVRVNLTKNYRKEGNK